MADEILKPVSAPQLFQLLERNNALSSWEDNFHKLFLDKLRETLERADEDPKRKILEIGSKPELVDVDAVLRAFPGFFFDDPKRYLATLIAEWAQKKGRIIDIDDPVFIGKLRELKSLDFSRRDARVIEDVIGRIEELTNFEGLEVQTDEEKLRETFEEFFNQLHDPSLTLLGNTRSKLKEVLDAYEDDPKVVVTDNIQKQIDASEDLKSTKQKQVDDTKKEADKKLKEEVEKFFRENWEEFWSGESKKRADLVIEILRSNRPSSEAVTALAEDFIEYFGKPTPHHITARNSLEIFFGEFTSELQDQLKKLEEKRKELVDKAQEEFEKKALAFFGATPIIKPEAEGQAPEVEEEKPADKTEIASAAKQQLSAHFQAVRQLDAVTQASALDALVLAAFNFPDFKIDPTLRTLNDLEDQLIEGIDEQAAKEEVTPESLRNTLNTLLQALRAADAEYLEAAKVEQPEPTVTPAAELVTEIPAETEQLTPDQSRKAISDLLDAQNTLVTHGLEELRLALQKAGFHPTEIDQIIARNRETFSQQIWMEFLQRGGLDKEKTFSFSEMANIWAGVVNHTTERIKVEQGKTDQPLITGAAMAANATPEQIESLHKFLEEIGISESEIQQAFKNLNKDTFEQLAAYSSGVTGVTDQERFASKQQQYAAIRNFLTTGQRAKDLKFTETDLDIVVELIASQDALGLLRREISEGASIFSDAEKKTIHQLLGKSVLSESEKQQLIQVYAFKVWKKYGLTQSDLFNHLNAEQINQIYLVLSRQQAAAEFLEQQLQNFPRGGNFINPYKRGGKDLRVKGALDVTEEQAIAHAKDTLMLEITLSVAFERGQDVNIALVMQEFYANPTFALMATGLGAAYNGEGGLLPNVPQTPGALGDQRMRQLYGGQKTVFNNLAQTQQAKAAQKGAQSAALFNALARSGGNPALLAKNILTDPNAQAALLGMLEQHKYEILAGIGLAAAPPLALLGLAIQVFNAIKDFALGIINGIGNFIGGIGQGISGFVSGITGGTTAGLTGTTALGAEIGANAGTTAKVAASQVVPATQTAVSTTALGTITAVNTFVASTTTAVTPLIAIIAAVVGPMAFATIMTFIVYSVIGSSLNGATFEAGISFGPLGGIPGIGRPGCWPVDGSISTLESYPDNPNTPEDESGPHATSQGGTAIDISAPTGTPIYTPFAGVARARYEPGTANGGYGLFVRMRTEFGFDVIFAHMSAFPNGVTAGQTFTVEAGESVGFVGSTGNSSGPHVHYETIGVNIYAVTPVPRNALRVGYRTSTTECSTGVTGDTTAPTGINPDTIGPQ